MRYGITLWGGTTEENMQRVLIIQKKAVRCLAGKERWEKVGDHFQPPSCKPLFRDLNLLTAPSCYIFDSIKCFLTNGNGILVKEASAYETRNADDYRLPKVRLEKSKQDVLYAGASFFNQLPADIKKIKGTKGFYKQLREQLIKKAVYFLAECWYLP